MPQTDFDILVLVQGQANLTRRTELRQILGHGFVDNQLIPELSQDLHFRSRHIPLDKFVEVWLDSSFEDLGVRSGVPGHN